MFLKKDRLDKGIFKRRHAGHNDVLNPILLRNFSTISLSTFHISEAKLSEVRQMSGEKKFFSDAADPHKAAIAAILFRFLLSPFHTTPHSLI
jgi:hypothetical protein